MCLMTLTFYGINQQILFTFRQKIISYIKKIYISNIFSAMFDLIEFSLNSSNRPQKLTFSSHFKNLYNEIIALKPWRISGGSSIHFNDNVDQISSIFWNFYHVEYSKEKRLKMINQPWKYIITLNLLSLYQH